MMWEKNKKKGYSKRRIVAILTATVVICVLLFSVFFIVTESEHDCVGDGCPICACIHQCETNLHIGGGSSIAAAFIAIIFLCGIILPLSEREIFCTSLVDYKVRLNH